MDKNNLKYLIYELEDILARLKTEVYADREMYLDLSSKNNVRVEDDDGYTD